MECNVIDLMKLRAKCCFMASVSLCLLLSGTPVLFAQQEGLPDGPPPEFQGPQNGGAPGFANVKKRLSQMTHRYKLDQTQQEGIRSLLESERQQVVMLQKDDSLAPQDMFTRMMTIHKVANEKIEALLTEAQKARFEEDEAKLEDRRHPMEQTGGPGEMPPPPGGPPPAL